MFPAGIGCACERVTAKCEDNTCHIGYRQYTHGRNFPENRVKCKTHVIMGEKGVVRPHSATQGVGKLNGKFV